MKTRNKFSWLVLPILAVMIASLACGTGFSTKSTIYGLSGKLQANLKEGDGVYNFSIVHLFRKGGLLGFGKSLTK